MTLLHDIGWQVEYMSFTSTLGAAYSKVWAWNLRGKFYSLDEDPIANLGPDVPIAEDTQLIFEGRKIAKSLGYWHPYIRRYKESDAIHTQLCGWAAYGNRRKRYMNARARATKIIEYRAGWDANLYPESILPLDEIYPL